jgi:hypothetical protein
MKTSIAYWSIMRKDMQNYYLTPQYQLGHYISVCLEADDVCEIGQHFRTLCQ